MKLDIFGEPVGFTVDGEESRKSYFGLFLSICIFAIMVPYDIKKCNILLTHGDTKLSDDLDPSGKDSVDRTNIKDFTLAFNVIDTENLTML